MSDFVTLRTALSGLIAARAGVDTASHNIANAATPGFTRQRVEQSTLIGGRSIQGGMIGSGTQITDISRTREQFLDMRLRSAVDLAHRANVRSSLLSQVEAELGEPTNGISIALSATWSAFEDLSLDPVNTAARQNVLSSLDSLTTRIRQLAGGWDLLESQATTELESAVGQVNDLLSEVHSVNAEIRRSGSLTATPNDLLDRRDLALDRLAELLGATSILHDNGTASVMLGGVSLVQEGGPSPLELGSDLDLLHPSGATLEAGGEVGGRQQFLTVDFPGYKAALDGFVEELTVSLNTRHADGWYSSTDTGAPLLSHAAGAAALTVQVALTDPEQLAVASSPGPPFPVHDGANAEWIAGLRIDESTPGSNSSLPEAWRAVVTRIGVDTATAAQVAQTQTDLAQAAGRTRESAHGVSIDEEMVQLMQYQHAYEASARVMTTVDGLLDVLINRTGLVGR